MAILYATGANWNTASHWGTTSGASDGAVPKDTDDLVFDENSVDMTLGTTNGVGKSIAFTGYTGTLTVTNVTLNISAASASQKAYARDGNETIAGNGSLRIYCQNTSITMDPIVWGSGGVRIDIQNASVHTANGITCGGEINVVFWNNIGTLDLNEATYNAGNFQYYTISASGTGGIDASNCTVDLAEDFYTGGQTGSGMTLNISGATISIGRSWLVNVGTLTKSMTTEITFDGTGTQNITSNGATLPDIIVNKAAGSVVLQGDLKCTDWDLNNGAFDANDYDLESSGDITFDSDDNITIDGNSTVKMTGSGKTLRYNSTGTVSVAVNHYFNGDTTIDSDLNCAKIIPFVGINVVVKSGSTLTESSYVAGDKNGAIGNAINYSASVPGTPFNYVNQANMVMSYTSWTDCNATNPIDCDNGTNTSGSGNTNLFFMDLASVNPNTASEAGGDVLTVEDNGTSFVGACTVTIDGTVVAATVIDNNTLTFVAPAKPSGIYNVQVTGVDGETDTLLNALTYASGSNVETESKLNSCMAISI